MCRTPPARMKPHRGSVVQCFDLGPPVIPGEAKELHATGEGQTGGPRTAAPFPESRTSVSFVSSVARCIPLAPFIAETRLLPSPVRARLVSLVTCGRPLVGCADMVQLGANPSSCRTPHLPSPTISPDTVACRMDPYRQPDWVPRRAKKNIPFVFSYMTPSRIREHPRLRPLPARPSWNSDPQVTKGMDIDNPARSVVEAPMHCPTSAAEALTFCMKPAHVVARLRERG